MSGKQLFNSAGWKISHLSMVTVTTWRIPKASRALPHTNPLGTENHCTAQAMLDMNLVATDTHHHSSCKLYCSLVEGVGLWRVPVHVSAEGTQR